MRPMVICILALLFSAIVQETAISEDEIVQPPPPHFVHPSQGFVPDEKTAKKIAEAVLYAVYGEDKIKSEEPLIINLAEGVWTVEGSLPPRFSVGGVAIVQISKEDGRIIRMTHEK